MNKHQPLILHIDPEKNEALKGKNMPRCPACDHEQVQLLNMDAPVSEWRWKCRVCKTRFTKESNMASTSLLNYWPQHPVSINRVHPFGWTDEWREVLARGGALLWWVRPDGVRVSPDGVEMFEDRAPLPPTTIVRVAPYDNAVARRDRTMDAELLATMRAGCPPSGDSAAAERDGWRDRALAAEAKLAAMGEDTKPGDYDYHGPTKEVVDPRTGRTVRRAVPDKVHERFHQSIGDVLSGKIMPEARRQMREAIDESDRAANKASPMPGRALRLTHADIGLKVR